jgi:hypothetical protein
MAPARARGARGNSAAAAGPTAALEGDAGAPASGCGASKHPRVRACEAQEGSELGRSGGVVAATAQQPRNGPLKLRRIGR